MPSKAKFGIVALCDAVYKDELTNKCVLAGIYSGGILVDALPVELRLALYVEIYLPDVAEHEIDLQFMVGGKQRGGAKALASSGEPNESTSLIISQFGIAFTEPTTFELRVGVDGGRPIKALTKTIGLRPQSPTA